MSWIDSVRSNVKAASALSKNGIVGTRKAVLAIWLAIDGANDNVRDLYRGFDEEALEADVDAVSLAGAFAKIPLSQPKNVATKEALLRCLAVCLRRLERELWGLAGSVVQRREKPTVVEFDGTSAHLVMRAPRHRVAKTDENFRRRGLKKMRLIPRKIGKIDVRLKFVQDFRGRARVRQKLPVSVAAALFPGLRFIDKTEPEGFVIVDIEFDDQLGVVRKQIRDASAAGCAAQHPVQHPIGGPGRPLGRRLDRMRTEHDRGRIPALDRQAGPALQRLHHPGRLRKSDRRTQEALSIQRWRRPP